MLFDPKKHIPRGCRSISPCHFCCGNSGMTLKPPGLSFKRNLKHQPLNMVVSVGWIQIIGRYRHDAMYHFIWLEAFFGWECLKGFCLKIFQNRKIQTNHHGKMSEFWKSRGLAQLGKCSTDSSAFIFVHESGWILALKAAKTWHDNPGDTKFRHAWFKSLAWCARVSDTVWKTLKALKWSIVGHYDRISPSKQHVRSV